jgi:hypothetical protein
LILYTEWSDEVSELSIRLRPVIEDDLEMFRRFAMEPDLVGLDWAGFRDAGAPARRFAADGYLGEDDSRLMVEVDEEHTRGGVRELAAERVRRREVLGNWDRVTAGVARTRYRLARAGDALRLPVPPHAGGADRGPYACGKHRGAEGAREGRLPTRGPAALGRVPRRPVARRVDLQPAQRRASAALNSASPPDCFGPPEGGSQSSRYCNVRSSADPDASAPLDLRSQTMRDRCAISRPAVKHEPNPPCRASTGAGQDLSPLLCRIWLLGVKSAGSAAAAAPLACGWRLGRRPRPPGRLLPPEAPLLPRIYQFALRPSETRLRRHSCPTPRLLRSEVETWPQQMATQLGHEPSDRTG